MLHGQIHSLAFVTTAGVELDGLVHLTFTFKVLCTLHHNWLRGDERHGHYLLVEPVLFSKSDSVMKSSTFTEVKDGFAHVAVILIVASQLEARLRIVGAQSKLGGVLDIANVA